MFTHTVCDEHNSVVGAERLYSKATILQHQAPRHSAGPSTNSTFTTTTNEARDAWGELATRSSRGVAKQKRRRPRRKDLPAAELKALREKDAARKRKARRAARKELLPDFLRIDSLLNPA